MIARLPFLLICGLLAVAGCQANRYQLKLAPTSEGLRRELTAWRVSTSDQGVVAFPEQELSQIAASYGTAANDERARRHEFAGVFDDQMPNDIGGSGSYLHWSTTLGSTSAYVERFRGEDDLVVQVERRQAACDRIADLVVAFADEQLAEQQGRGKLHAFLDKDLRRDLKNLSLYSWVSGVDGRTDEAVAEWLMRCGQYLVEREYFKPNDLPALVRALEEGDRTGSHRRLLRGVQRWVARHMGVAEGDPSPPALSLLDDEQRLIEKVDEFLSTTDEYRSLVRKWERLRRGDPEAQWPKPREVVDQLAAEAFVPTLLFELDQLEVALGVGQAPLETNGRWDAESRQVHWQRAMLPRRGDELGYPKLLYAVWCEPNEPVQKARFGAVILTGQSLAEYCLWRHGLTPQEADQWESMLSRLRPGAELADQVRAIRFAGHKDRETGPSQGGRELILDALP